MKLLNILCKEEILSKGKEFSTDIGFDLYTGLYVEMDTERPFNGIGYALFSNGEIIKWNEDGIMTYWAEFEADVKKRFKEWNNKGELI